MSQAKTESIFTLEKAARKAGGDKYTSEDGQWTVYVPQTLSRPGGAQSPVAKARISFEVVGAPKEGGQA